MNPLFSGHIVQTITIQTVQNWIRLLCKYSKIRKVGGVLNWYGSYYYRYTFKREKAHLYDKTNSNKLLCQFLLKFQSLINILYIQSINFSSILIWKLKGILNTAKIISFWILKVYIFFSFQHIFLKMHSIDQNFRQICSLFSIICCDNKLFLKSGFK